MAAAAGIGLSLCGTAFGKDSGHYVCSAVTSFERDGENSRIGISIVLDDWRAPGNGGIDRIRLLSWVYAGKLFQGSVRDTGNPPVNHDYVMQGHVEIKNGKRQMYAGAFKLRRVNAGQPDQSYALVLDGKVTDDPGSEKLYPVKATLPCIDIST
jgi:hypothetical protein